MAVILQFLLFYKEDSSITIEKPEHENAELKKKIETKSTYVLYAKLKFLR